MSDDQNVNDTTTPTDDTNGGETITEPNATTEPEAPETEPNEGGDETEPTEDEGGDETEQEGAPESYEPFTLPEGYSLDEEATGALESLGKKHGLKQEGVQDLVDAYIKESQRAKETEKAALFQEWEKEKAAWQTTLKKEWGDDFKKNEATVKKVIDTFYTSKEAKEYLENSAFAENPHNARMLLEIGKKISEDSLEIGGSSGSKTYNDITDIFPQPAMKGKT